MLLSVRCSLTANRDTSVTLFFRFVVVGASSDFSRSRCRFRLEGVFMGIGWKNEEAWMSTLETLNIENCTVHRKPPPELV